MKAFLKWTGVTLGAVIVFAAVTLVVVWVQAGSHLRRTYAIGPESITIPSDARSLARGAHLAVITGCTGCHGEDLGGQAVIEDPPFATVWATNLTAGEGGVGRTTDAAGFARAIRHGVGADGTSLWIMPSPSYNHLSDEDVGAIIAHLRSVPAVDRTIPARRLGPVGRYLVATSQAPGFLVAAEIDHEAERPAMPAPGVTTAYGEYLARLCIGCHGADFAGSTRPGRSGSPAARNLTPAGNLADWTVRDFITAMRTGVTRSGYAMDPDYMPWPSIGKATDRELEAIFRYLRELPPVPSGSD